jgi:LysM repeat protein
MDSNERLLSRIVQERAAHARPSGFASTWRLLGTALVVALVGLGSQLALTSGPVEKSSAADITAVHAVTASPPEAAVEDAVPSNPPAAIADIVPAASSRPHRYVVQPGDSVQAIAAQNGLRPATLVSLNNLDPADPLPLLPGRELVIPDRDGLIHVVESGDTLRRIAERYHVQLSTLVSVNGLSDPDRIAVGLRLFVPSVTGPIDAQGADS